MHTVLNTVELLEQIFVHLPVHTIFVSQRVCKQFRDLVETSVVIQLKLGLRPTKDEPETCIIEQTYSQDDHVGTNKLSFLPRATAMETLVLFAELPDNVRRSRSKRTLATLNPILSLRLPDPVLLTRFVTSPIMYQEQTFFAIDGANVMDHSSWRRVYPIGGVNGAARVFFRWKIGSHDGRVTLLARSIEGLTLGDIVTLALQCDGKRLVSGSYMHGNQGRTGIGYKGTKTPERTLEGVLQWLERELRSKVVVVGDLCMTFSEVVFPTEQERQTIRAVG